MEAECKDYFSRSLFVVGEFGGNDYNAFFFAGKDIKEVRADVHIIVGGIIKGLEVRLRHRDFGFIN